MIVALWPRNATVGDNLSSGETALDSFRACFPVEADTAAAATPAKATSTIRISVALRISRPPSHFTGVKTLPVKRTAGYYLISYYTKKRPGEHGFQKVDVALRNPEFKVTSRAGYLYGD